MFTFVYLLLIYCSSGTFQPNTQIGRHWSKVIITHQVSLHGTEGTVANSGDWAVQVWYIWMFLYLLHCHWTRTTIQSEFLDFARLKDLLIAFSNESPRKSECCFFVLADWAFLFYSHHFYLIRTIFNAFHIFWFTLLFLCGSSLYPWCWSVTMKV